MSVCQRRATQRKQHAEESGGRGPGRPRGKGKNGKKGKGKGATKSKKQNEKAQKGKKGKGKGRGGRGRKGKGGDDGVPGDDETTPATSTNKRKRGDTAKSFAVSCFD